MNVPLLDLKEQYRSIADEVMRAVTSVIDDQRFILGPVVDEFERQVEAKLGVKHAVGCASGTDAILLALRAFVTHGLTSEQRTTIGDLARELSEDPAKVQAALDQHV